MMRIRVAWNSLAILMTGMGLGLMLGWWLGTYEPTYTPDVQRPVVPAIKATSQVGGSGGPRAAAAPPKSLPTRASSSTLGEIAEPVLPTATAASPLRVSGDAVAPGEMMLTATYNSIGVELLFSGDDDADARVELDFRKTGEATWRRGLPLWRTDDGSTSPGRAFYGSALLLEPGTSYDVRATILDPDGVVGSSVLAASITTRKDNILAVEQLSSTHYVSVAGSDSNSGTSPSLAWRTLEKAFSAAPAGAVVQVAPGSYAPPTRERTLAITLVAEHPAVDDARNPINQGLHSVIEPQIYSAPAGESGERYVAPWTRVTFKGPATGGSYSVWKWANSPLSGASRMGIASRRDGEPVRVVHWDRKTGTFNGYTMETPEGWAEVLYSNGTYNYGFTSFGQDVYARLPSDTDPNGYYAYLHSAHSTNVTAGRLLLNGPGIRLSGFEVRMADVLYLSGSIEGVVDHNLFLSAALLYRGKPGPPSIYPRDHTVERNLFHDTGLWSIDPERPAIPWWFVKYELKIGGASTPWRRIGGEAETTAISGRGGAQRLVVRHNTIEGYFNGISPGYQKDFDRYAGYNQDVHNNLIRRLSDDALEPDGQTINWRAWNNRVESSPVQISNGPTKYGPVYLFRNEFWRMSNEGVGADGYGNKVVGVLGFKYSGSSTPPARVYVVHNTFWTDRPGGSGGSQAAGGGAAQERYWLRNNIFRMTAYAFSVANGNTAPARGDLWDEDYNHFYTSDPVRGLKYAGTNYRQVADYRVASGHGSHTNMTDLSGEFRTDPQLADAANGDLGLPKNSSLIDAGTPVPNISESYSGVAPDLGAGEYGSASGDDPSTSSDTTSPSVSLPSPAASTKVSGRVQLTAEAFDDRGVARVDFLLSGAIVGSDVAAPYSVEWDTTTTADGAINIAAVAVDTAGNKAISSHSVTVDNTQPETTIVSGPSGSTRTSSAEFTFSASEQGSQFQCRLDSGSFEVCTSPKQYSALTNGQHVFEVRAVDGAGNTDPTSAIRTWLVDTVVPSGRVSINSGSKNTRSTLVSLSLSASDPSPASGIGAMRFSNDGAVWSIWQTYSSTATWTLTNSNGTKTVYAQFRDRAGNVSLTAWDTIKLDNQKPTSTRPSQNLQLNSQVARIDTDTTTVYSIPVRVSWSLYDDISGVKSYDLQQSIDGGPFITVQSLTLQQPTARISGSKLVQSLPGHTYRYRTRVRDWAGNVALEYGSGVRLLAHQETSRAISYTDSQRMIGGSAAYHGYVKRSTLAGATARFSFLGQDVAWVAPKAPTSGQARIFLDGKYVGTLDLYSSVRSYRKLAFARNGLSQATTHTLEVKAVGTADRPAVDLDAFVVLRCVSACD